MDDWQLLSRQRFRFGVLYLGTSPESTFCEWKIECLHLYYDHSSNDDEKCYNGSGGFSCWVSFILGIINNLVI